MHCFPPKHTESMPEETFAFVGLAKNESLRIRL